MSWSINEVARDSGVTSRTLRHYHAVGLLTPAWTEPGGRRFYEREQLLRLQRIRVLRELGLGLGAIGEILAGQDRDSTVDVLRRHRDWLLAERDRVDRLVATVENTMTDLEEGGTMSTRAMFDGFETNPYETEARARWGDDAVDDTDARMRNWSPEQAEQAKNGFDEVRARLVELREAGAAVDDERVQQTVDAHYRWIRLFWTPDRDAYQGLADLYTDDDRFRQNIGQGDDGVVEYLRDAMKVYAGARLS
ncbi:DNA-binding transcriptional MerR regulator [Haloactinopolyspora alba]|uniref:DNA-binding transcriptional MerR regulator n=1 Tax=Haloactinopolyspora alba TaxID=648780 RepID=A0A2P8E6N8_9ACTN|nr:MerR family transcriptional regulator [Haloactinopolyspora alba]PSL05141.1 DNA-binding transcriptional MerR regulator [Haloactinopolyspora alba]